jgi:hypothetical protein
LSIQNEIVNVAVVETTKVIIEDLGDELFDILVDESRDVSDKKQIVVVIRYFNKYVVAELENILGVGQIIFYPFK